MTSKIAKPSILTRIPPSHAVVEASAGTGKTYTIESLVVDQILTRSIPIDQVLVVTFTRKAAAELNARIRQKIRQMLDAPDGGIVPEPAWVLDDDARGRLSRALRDFDLAPISTIHSFCQAVLSEHELSSGRLSSADAGLDDMFHEAFTDTLRRVLGTTEPYLPVLEEALSAGWSVADLEKLLRSVHRMRAPVRPRVPVGELAPRQEALSKVLSMCPGTLGDELKQHGVRTGYAVHERVIALARTWSGLAGSAPMRLQREFWRWAAECGGTIEGEKLDGIDYLRKGLHGRGTYATNLYAALEHVFDAAPSWEAVFANLFLPVVEDRLRRIRETSGTLDHDSLLDTVLRVLQGAGGEHLVESLRRRYRVALVDEFQDTDRVQWEIFRRIFVEPGGGEHRLIVVGDPKQAIYRFRGGDVFTFVEATRELEKFARRVPLDENWRSSAAMVDSYNRILERGPDGAPFFGRGGVDYSSPVGAGDRSLSLDDASGGAPRPVGLLQVHAVDVGVPDVRPMLLGAIASEIHDILGAKWSWRRLADGAMRTYPIGASDIMCLTFTNREAQEIGEELRRWSIPFALYREEGLLVGEEARDVLDLLDAISDPRDGGRRRRAWMTPFFEIEFAALDSLGDLPSDHPLQALLLRWASLAEQRRWGRLFSEILTSSGLSSRARFAGGRERELANYESIVDMLLEQTQLGVDSVRRLAGLLRGWVTETTAPPDEDANVQRLPSDRPAVRVLTVHKAKGLEAPIAFLYGGLARGPRGGDVQLFHDRGERAAWVGPPRRDVQQAIDREEDEETRRLLYVAMTRARFRTYLPYFGPADGSSSAATQWKPRSGITGRYAALHERLVQLVRGDESFRRACDFRKVERQPRPVAASPAGAWTTGAIAHLEEEVATATRHAAHLRDSHAGLLITSFSSMKDVFDVPEPATDEVADEAPDAPALPPADPAELPRGKGPGTLVHALIESIPYAVTKPGVAFDSWRAQADIESVFSSFWSDSRLTPAQRRHAEHMVHAALTTPIALPGGERTPGLAGENGFASEVEFLFPLPESGDVPLGMADVAGRWRAERGFLKGFIDFTFERAGRLHFGDWKTNTLAGYEPAAVERDVVEKYRGQVLIYSLALVKAAGIRTQAEYDARFGGAVYVYVRGLDGTGNGVGAMRPSFAELQELERLLARESDEEAA